MACPCFLFGTSPRANTLCQICRSQNSREAREAFRFFFPLATNRAGAVRKPKHCATAHVALGQERTNTSSWVCIQQIFPSHWRKIDAFALFDGSPRWAVMFETLAPVVPARLWRDRIVQNPCQIKAVSRQRGQTGIEATTLSPWA